MGGRGGGRDYGWPWSGAAAEMGNDSDGPSVNETKTQFFWRRRESRKLAL